MTENTLDDYCWLVSQDGRDWLTQLLNDSRSLVQQTQYLRKHVTASRAHLLLETVELRQRAQTKFEAAARMFFTRTGLEQASDQWIAAYKAQRFPAQQPIADLCCGIGGDLFGLAAHTTTVGVDRDPVHAALAASNCRVLELQHFQVDVADAATFDVRDVAAWHIDPDRRPTGHRTTQLDYSAPSTSDIDALLSRQPHAALKAAPASELPPHWMLEAERQWIGSGRECKQQVVWFGDLAQHAGQHSASVVHHRGQTSELLVGAPNQHVPIAPSVDRFVSEPHAAVLAAKLTGVLADKHNLQALDHHVDYLTSEHSVEDPLISCFEVLELLPFDVRRLRSAIRSRNIGTLEVKKRGVAVDPADVRRKVQGTGPHKATLLLAPHAGTVRAILCRRWQAS